MCSYKDDVEFVLSEVVRFSTIDVRELIKLPFPEYFVANLPSPDGGAALFCGMEAYNRLLHLTERSISVRKLTNRIDADEVFDHLRKGIVDRFILKDQEPTSSLVSSLIRSAIQSSEKSISPQTHLIPCHFGRTDTPDFFTIGPVTFKKRDALFQELDSALASYVTEDTVHKNDTRTKEERREHAQEILNEAMRYYESFSWVAQIEVPDCAPKPSQKRAARLVRNAVDCLHLLLGGPLTSNIKVSGERIETDRRGYITILQNGRVEISNSIAWPSSDLPDGWWGKINENDGGYLIDLMGHAIILGNDFTTPYPLAERFLDATAWYSEAIRDTFPASKIAKYVFSIERMVTTKKEARGGVVLCERAAALLHVPKSEDYVELKEKFREIYDVRNQLAHGSISPHEKNIVKYLRDSEKLARNTLLRGLQFFTESGLRRERIELVELDNYFDDCIIWAETDKWPQRKKHEKTEG